MPSAIPHELDDIRYAKSGVPGRWKLFAVAD
jgi:hypothetical protein